MLFIIIGHISGTMHTVVFSPLAGTGVFLFLILSGYGLNESFRTNGLVGYWKKRIIRVMIPYAIFIIAYRCIRHQFTPVPFILDVVCLKTTYWFVEYIAWWYIIFYITTKWIPRYRLVTMAVVGTVLLFTLPQRLEQVQAYSFLFGVLLSEKGNKLLRISPKHWVSIMVISFVVGTIILGIKQLPTIRAISDSMAYTLIQLSCGTLYAFTILAFIIAFPKFTSSRFLLLAGGISFELYLFHFPFYPQVDGNLTRAYLLIFASFLAAWFYAKGIGLLCAKTFGRKGRPLGTSLGH